MNREEAFELVKKYLSGKFEIEEEKIKPKAHLFTDLGLDSIDALDMAGMLEAEMDIEINEEELKKIRTVQDTVNYIVRKNA